MTEQRQPVLPSLRPEDTVRRFVRIGMIIQILGLPFMVLPAVHFRNSVQLAQIIAVTLTTILVLWRIAAFQNWARRCFLAAAIFRVPYLAPQKPFWIALAISLIHPATPSTLIAIFAVLDIIYSITFGIVLLQRHIRAQFAPKLLSRAGVILVLLTGGALAYVLGRITANVENQEALFASVTTQYHGNHSPHDKL